MRLFLALHFVLFATSVSAAPSPLTLAVSKRIGNGPYLHGFATADRARADYLRNITVDYPVSNFEYLQYSARVGIGSPPTYYNLIVDTGSSNTFCGTGISYVRTSTSISTGQTVNSTYGSGNFAGLEYLDQVTLAPNLVITNQSIGDALHSAGFQGFDGILGLGPVDITRGTLSPDRNETIPTVMNNLASQGLIKEQVLGVYFAPPTKYNDTNGVLTIGGLDSSLYLDNVTYVPLTKTPQASFYWGINIADVTYGNVKVFPASTAGVVDTGSTLVMLAEEAFEAYKNAIPGATLDDNTGLIKIPDCSIEKMHPLNFHIGSNVFSMDVSAQLFPKDQNNAFNGDSNKTYGTVTTLGAVLNSSLHGIDFILGQKFMERFYTVFDADAARVGFALTNHTYSSQKG